MACNFVVKGGKALAEKAAPEEAAIKSSTVMACKKLGAEPVKGENQPEEAAKIMKIAMTCKNLGGKAQQVAGKIGGEKAQHGKAVGGKVVGGEVVGGKKTSVKAPKNQQKKIVGIVNNNNVKIHDTQLVCVCGSATKSLFYKRIQRQTHQAPSCTPSGSNNFHTKVCVTCEKRYSVCNRHPDLGWQEWQQRKHYGRHCTAVMWTHNCKECARPPKMDLATVLCPECKVFS